MTIAEETVMADAMKAVRQGVQQETPNELIGRQGHHLALVVMPVIAPTEADLIARHVDQPAVRDGDAVRIATEIGQDRRRAGKGALGVDHPLRTPQFTEAAGEDRCGGKTGQRAEERQSAGLERRLQVFQEQPAEQPREDTHRQKEAGPTRNPTPAVRRQAATGDQAMHVRMVLQVLTPGMEHSDETDLGAEVAGIGGDRAQGFSRRLEQDGVDRGLVLKSDFGGRRRQGEDDVKIRHRQQFGLPFSQPGGARRSLTFRAMSIAARIIGDTNETALGAALDMAAERRGATRLDRAHDAPFGAAEVAGMRLAVRLAVAAEDIRHLERGHDWPVLVWRRFRQLQPVERADGVADRGSCDLGVTRRGRQMLMAEQHHGLRRGRLWIVRISVPASSRWVAKLWRSVWTLTGFPSFAVSRALRHTQCSVLTWSGWLSLRPGNSQCFGRISCQ